MLPSEIKDILSALGWNVGINVRHWKIDKSRPLNVVLFVKVGISARRIKVKEINFEWCQSRSGIFVVDFENNEYIIDYDEIAFWEVNGKRSGSHGYGERRPR